MFSILLRCQFAPRFLKFSLPQLSCGGLVRSHFRTSLSRPCAADRVVQAIKDLGYNPNPKTILKLGNRLDKPAADCSLRSHQPLCPTHALSSLSASRLVAASCIAAAIYARLSCHSPSLSFASSHFASFPSVTAFLRHGCMSPWKQAEKWAQVRLHFCWRLGPCCSCTATVSHSSAARSFSFRPSKNLACAQTERHETCEQSRITCIFCVCFHTALDDVNACVTAAVLPTCRQSIAAG
jgi:hypothetical protein